VEADIGQAVVAEHTQGVQRLGTISDDLPDVVRRLTSYSHSAVAYLIFGASFFRFGDTA